MPELLGNKAVEAAAIEWVMGLERAAGREPRDTRYVGGARRHRVAAATDRREGVRQIELRRRAVALEALVQEEVEVDTPYDETRLQPVTGFSVVDPNTNTCSSLDRTAASRESCRASASRWYRKNEPPSIAGSLMTWS